MRYWGLWTQTDWPIEIYSVKATEKVTGLETVRSMEKYLEIGKEIKTVTKREIQKQTEKQTVKLKD